MHFKAHTYPHSHPYVRNPYITTKDYITITFQKVQLRVAILFCPEVETVRHSTLEEDGPESRAKVPQSQGSSEGVSE